MKNRVLLILILLGIVFFQCSKTKTKIDMPKSLLISLLLSKTSSGGSCTLKSSDNGILYSCIEYPDSYNSENAIKTNCGIPKDSISGEYEKITGIIPSVSKWSVGYYFGTKCETNDKKYTCTYKDQNSQSLQVFFYQSAPDQTTATSYCTSKSGTLN